MKLIGLAIFRVDPSSKESDPIMMCASLDMSDAPLLYRSRARELAVFNMKLIAKNVAPMSRTQVKDDTTGSLISCESSCNGRLVAVAVTDKEYLLRITFDLLRKVSLLFVDSFRGKWEAVQFSKDEQLAWPELGHIRAEYHDGKADQINKIQSDIEATKITMIDAIDKVLGRGELIDDLVQRSALLSDEAKGLHTTAKKMNSWCACMIQ